MARGEWHDFCRVCKQSEDNTGVSARTQRQIDLATRAAIDQDINWFEPQDLVINWSNLCNLSCTYCNPETSTAWQAVKKIPINFVRNEHQDLIDLAKKQGHAVKGLLLGGGEPLLQKGLVEFLQCLDPAQVQVLVTTNLIADLDTNPVYQELRSWPHVDWQISFDNCTPTKFEYVRDRATWTQFLNNIDKLKQGNQYVAAHPAYSLYCALDLVEYYEFCTDRELGIFWCELQHPWDLDARRLARPIRDLAVAEIDRVIERWGSDAVTRFSLAIDTLERYRSNLISPEYLTNFDSYFADPIKYHKSVEAELGKTIAFQQAWPELTELLNQYHYAKK